MSTSVIVYAGNDYTGDLAVQLPPAGLDITGFELTFTVAERVSGDIVIEKTYGEVTADDYIEGVALVELEAFDTIGLGNGPLNYELTGLDYEFRERTLLQGRFYITTGLESGS